MREAPKCRISRSEGTDIPLGYSRNSEIRFRDNISKSDFPETVENPLEIWSGNAVIYLRNRRCRNIIFPIYWIMCEIKEKTWGKSQIFVPLESRLCLLGILRILRYFDKIGFRYTENNAVVSTNSVNSAKYISYLTNAHYKKKVREFTSIVQVNITQQRNN